MGRLRFSLRGACSPRRSLFPCFSLSSRLLSLLLCFPAPLVLLFSFLLSRPRSPPFCFLSSSFVFPFPSPLTRFRGFGPQFSKLNLRFHASVEGSVICGVIALGGTARQSCWSTSVAIAFCLRNCSGQQETKTGEKCSRYLAGAALGSSHISSGVFSSGSLVHLQQALPIGHFGQTSHIPSWGLWCSLWLWQYWRP